jgi:hypothetical protein
MGSGDRPKKRVYQIKVTLKDSKPPIWRRIQVTRDTNLHTFHHILQVVMGWSNAHPHVFIIGTTFYGIPGPEYDFEMKDEKEVTLNQVVSEPKSRFTYEYDFGDCWQHEILVEEVLPMQRGVQYPSCLGGMRACPPEDCGGVWGYAGILGAVEYQNHPQYYDMLKWVEDGFDPESFDMNEINRELRTIQS